MRAPLSKLASDVMADPQAAQAMRQWIDQPTAPLDLTLTRSDGTIQAVRATRRHTIVPTHGNAALSTSLPWPKRTRRFFDELLGVFINPLG